MANYLEAVLQGVQLALFITAFMQLPNLIFLGYLRLFKYLNAKITERDTTTRP